MEVLLEVEQTSRLVNATQDTILEVIETELEKVGLDVFMIPFSFGMKDLEGFTRVPYKLQKWVGKFNRYVDITDKSQVNDGDRLTVAVAYPTADAPSGSKVSH